MWKKIGIIIMLLSVGASAGAFWSGPAPDPIRLYPSEELKGFPEVKVLWMGTHDSCFTAFVGAGIQTNPVPASPVDCRKRARFYDGTEGK